MKDLYAILGVAKSAPAEEIKRAYRALAKRYHPDLHPGDRQAETRFKELGEAYATLGDEEKRKAYDAARAQAAGARPGAGAGQRKASRAPTNPDFDISNMAQGFESFFGFNPKTGEVTDEQKVSGAKKPKNPLDVSGLFERYMGFKK